MVTINIGRKETIFFAAFLVTFFVLNFVLAATPNPGHSLAEVGIPTCTTANQVLKWDNTNLKWVCGTDEAGGVSTDLIKVFSASPNVASYCGSKGGRMIITCPPAYQPVSCSIEKESIADAEDVPSCSMSMTACNYVLDRNGESCDGGLSIDCTCAKGVAVSRGSAGADGSSIIYTPASTNG